MMSEENLYVRNDLEDYAETPTRKMSRHPKRSELIGALLPASADIDFYSTGGYQGHMGFVIKLDGYIWLLPESYGSCSVCDGLLSASDKLEYGRSMLRNAYCFETEREAKQFLNEKRVDGTWKWRKIAGEMHEMI